MKKEYLTPDFQLVTLRLNADILESFEHNASSSITSEITGGSASLPDELNEPDD